MLGQTGWTGPTQLAEIVVMNLHSLKLWESWYLNTLLVYFACKIMGQQNSINLIIWHRKRASQDGQTLILYEGLMQLYNCVIVMEFAWCWGFHMLFSYSVSVRKLTKPPLKQKSLKRSSQESWCTLSNKHSMTNPSSQMTRPSHLTHNERSPSKWLQSKTSTQTWVMELRSCQ